MIEFNVKTEHAGEIRIVLLRRHAGGNFSYRFWAHGRKYMESCRSPVEREARAKARDAAYKASRPRGPDGALSATIDTYLSDRWPEEPEEVRKNNRTFLNQFSRLNLFKKNLENTNIGLLSAAEMTSLIQSYFDERTRNGKSGRTVITDRSILSQFCRWLIKNKRAHWEHNPALALSIDLPPVKDPEPTPIPDPELQRFLPLARKNDVWPIVVLCLGAGLRPAEAVRLTWRDVDLTERIARVINKKGKKPKTRTPELNDWVIAELDRIKGKPEDPIFPYSPSTAFDFVAALRKAAFPKKKGKPKYPDLQPSIVTLQNMRQTACTRAILGNMKLVDYVQQFGHNLSTAERHYLKWGRRQQRLESLKVLDFSSLLSKTGTKTGTTIS